MKSSLIQIRQLPAPVRTKADIIPINTKIYRNRPAKEPGWTVSNDQKLPLFDNRPIFKSKEHDSL